MCVILKIVYILIKIKMKYKIKIIEYWKIFFIWIVMKCIYFSFVYLKVKEFIWLF